MTRHQCGISVLLLRRRFVRAQVVTSRNVGCFLRLMCIEFTGESAEDTGGPTRELFSLVYQ